MAPLPLLSSLNLSCNWRPSAATGLQKCRPAIRHQSCFSEGPRGPPLSAGPFRPHLFARPFR